MFMSKSIFESLNGFASTVLEDGDFAARLKKAGYIIKYEPHARVLIDEPETFSELIRAKKRYGKGTFFCAFRHKRVYMTSRQALLSFDPGFLIIALILAFIITTPFINLIAAVLILLFIPALALINIRLVSGDRMRRMVHNENYMKMMSLSFAPIVILTYLFGVASGIRDKLSAKPELKFKDW